jgi:hypothetical protein
MEVNKMNGCKYIKCYASSNCGDDTVNGSDFCLEHINKECVSCKEQATYECCHTGQFVCGAPLCDNCTGFVDSTKPSGNWGFMNHGHRPKEIK